MGDSKKSFVMLSILSLILVTMTIFQFSPLANATGEITSTQGEIITQTFSQEGDIGRFDEIIETTPFSENETSLNPSSNVDNSINLNLDVGTSWIDTFKMNNLTNADHNTLNIKISNVTNGKYKVIITATNGYRFESSEYLSSSITTLKNANPDVTYSVIILNTSASTLRASTDVTSYIN